MGLATSSLLFRLMLMTILLSIFIYDLDDETEHILNKSGNYRKLGGDDRPDDCTEDL